MHPTHPIEISDFGFRISDLPARGTAKWLGPSARDWAEEIRDQNSPPQSVSAPERGQYTSGPPVTLHRADKSEIRNPKSEIFSKAHSPS